MPLFFNSNMNNYQAGATDTLGLTTRSITFHVEEDLTDAAFFLITSNHGANQGGEEYIRRFHYAYFDGALELTYKPWTPHLRALPAVQHQAEWDLRCHATHTSAMAILQQLVSR
jgi:hypothetical protein